MATALLRAIGLPGNAATTVDEYVEIACAHVLDSAHHARVKAALAGDAWSRTIGDAAGFARRIEAAYERIRLRP